jgi:serine/threonine protein phosphatase PrpC
MGSVLSSPVELIRVQRQWSSNFKCGVAEMQGWRVNHEDAHEIRCKGSCAALWVLDGHGGDGAALYGAPDLAKEFEADLADGCVLPPDDRLEAGFSAVDQRLHDYLSANPEKESGSTVVGALCAQQSDGSFTVKLLNCGDSRGLVVRGPKEEEASAAAVPVRIPLHIEALAGDAAAVARGDTAPTCNWPLIAETVDHKPSHATEKARIEAAGGHVSEEEPPRLDGNLAVSRGLGDFEYKGDNSRPVAEQKVSCIPDIYEISGLRKGTIVVLACDGVWDVLTGENVASFVRDKLVGDPVADLGDVAAEVIRMCLKRNSRDNITCMIALLGDGADGVSMADEMIGYERLLDKQDTLDEDVKKKYNEFLRKCKFPPEPVICGYSPCRKWLLEMNQCPCKTVYYCSRACQKKDWKTHKESQGHRDWAKANLEIAMNGQSNVKQN